MTTNVYGPLRLVTDRPATLVQVSVRAPRPRPHAGGMVVDFTTPATVRGGEVSFPCVPGPAVLSVTHAGVPQVTVPLVVPDQTDATLEQCMHAAQVADEVQAGALQTLALRVLEDAKAAGKSAQAAGESAQAAAADRADVSEARRIVDAYRQEVTGLRDATVASAAAAKQSEENADTSQASAADSASAASASETAAASSASQAAESATQAAGSARDSDSARNDASQKADEASISAGRAQEQADRAQQGADSATASAESATASAEAAKTSETNAKDSETNAGTSKDSAASSASDAAASESAAASSALQAAGSAEEAAGSASSANDALNNATQKASESNAAAERATSEAERAFESAERAETVAFGDIPGASADARGLVRLSGDLGGSADSPTVPGLSDKLDSSEAVADASPGVVVRRGDSGEVSVPQEPSAATDAVSRGYVDGLVSGKADLVEGRVPSSQIPGVALTKPHVVSDRAGMLGLTAEEGDVAVVTQGDDKGTYMLGDGDSTVFESWVKLATPDGAVSSVNGQTGVVNLTASNVGAAAASHTHTTRDVQGLQDVLDEKADRAWVESQLEDLSTNAGGDTAPARSVNVRSNFYAQWETGAISGDRSLLATSNFSRLVFAEDVTANYDVVTVDGVTITGGDVIESGTAVRPNTSNLDYVFSTGSGGQTAPNITPIEIVDELPQNAKDGTIYIVRGS